MIEKVPAKLNRLAMEEMILAEEGGFWTSDKGILLRLEDQILCANCNWIKRIELKEDGRKS